MYIFEYVYVTSARLSRTKALRLKKKSEKERKINNGNKREKGDEHRVRR